MNPSKQVKKLINVQEKAQLCVTREDAQKYIRKSKKILQKLLKK